MKHIVILLLMLSTGSYALSPWLENLEKSNKQQQLDLRWKASGGQVDLKFMYTKLNQMNIQVSPKPEFPNKHWDYNHLVYPVSNKSSLELQMPYGNIEKVTSGALSINSDFSLTYGKHTIKVNSFKLVPSQYPTNKSDIVTFDFIDQNDNHLFTIDSVHIEYDKDKGLLLMSNMDLFATKELASLLHYQFLENQIIGQIHTYSNLAIPENAEKELLGNVCGTGPGEHPVWPPEGDVDVSLIDIGSVQWVRNIVGGKIVVAPSARLKNVGTAEVPWYSKFTIPHDPYNNDQHPFLNWAMYREIDGRFEQIGYSGVKHAFLTINSNCTVNCGDNHILWLGCEDVYGVGNNDSSSALGPRAGIEADTGFWDNCNSFFDPNCVGSQQASSNNTDQNRLVVHTSDLEDVDNDNIFIQAWYLIRDDINIFNTMGYRSLNPSENLGSWNMNPANDFTNGAALDNYVPPNTISAMQASQTVETGEGQFTVAVKVVDIGGGLYRYNYAVENYEFDPRFISYSIPLSDFLTFTDAVFVDPEHDVVNDWQFNRNNGVLTIQGNASNEQDWGMLFSFSFTTNTAPVVSEISINAANMPVNPLNTTVKATTLIPDQMFINGFE